MKVYQNPVPVIHGSATSSLSIYTSVTNTGCFTKDRQTCGRYRGHKDDSESHGSAGPKMP